EPQAEETPRSGAEIGGIAERHDRAGSAELEEVSVLRQPGMRHSQTGNQGEGRAPNHIHKRNRCSRGESLCYSESRFGPLASEGGGAAAEASSTRHGRSWQSGAADS